MATQVKSKTRSTAASATRRVASLKKEFAQKRLAISRKARETVSKSQSAQGIATGGGAFIVGAQEVFTQKAADDDLMGVAGVGLALYGLRKKNGSIIGFGSGLAAPTVAKYGRQFGSWLNGYASTWGK